MATSKIVQDVRRLTGAYENPESLIIVGIDPIPKGVDLDEIKQFQDDSERHEPPDEGLIVSIMTHGVNDPITCYSVRATSGDRYRIVVNGRQRVMGAREANKRLKAQKGDYFIQVPYVTKNDSDARTVVISNEFRKRKTPLMRAREAKRLLDWGHTKDQVCASFQADDGTTISKQTLDNWLSLLKLTPADQERLRTGALGLTEAYALGRGKAPPAPASAPSNPAPGPARPSSPRSARPPIKAVMALADAYAPREHEPHETEVESVVHAMLVWFATGDTSALDRWPEVVEEIAKVSRPSANGRAGGFHLANEEM